MSGKNSTFLNNNPPTVDDIWLNMVTTEVKNFITNTGQTPTDADLFQIAKGVANAASVSNFYTDSGTTNSYVLTPVTPFKAPDAYRNGMEIRFRAGNVNNGSSTINVAGLGILNIRQSDGVNNLIGGEILTTADTRLRYNGSVAILESLNVAPASQGAVSAGVVADKFVAPSTLAGLFNNSSRLSNGYIRIPVKVGGAFVEIIVQWGTSAGSNTIPYTITFPNSALQVYTNLLLNGSQGTITYSSVINGSINAANFQSIIDSDNLVFNWLAIGY